MLVFFIFTHVYSFSNFLREEMRRNDDDPYRRQFQTHAAAGNGHPLVSNTASLVSNRDNTDRVVGE